LVALMEKVALGKNGTVDLNRGFRVDSSGPGLHHWQASRPLRRLTFPQIRSPFESSRRSHPRPCPMPDLSIFTSIPPIRC
jgi:hypothetical protein